MSFVFGNRKRWQKLFHISNGNLELTKVSNLSAFNLLK